MSDTSSNGVDNGVPAEVFLSAIRMDDEGGATQLREALNEETVGRYAEAMERRDVFPLVDLVDAGDGTYFIADGWHRIAARLRLGKVAVRAVVHPKPVQGSPLQEAIRLALKSNRKHGLPFTRGDQKRKARAALLHPDYQGWSLRALEAETGIGKSTIARVRTALFREGALEHPKLGSKMPEWMPEDHASEYALKGTFLDDEEMEWVYSFIQQLTPEGDPRDWDWDSESQRVVHSGLIAGKTVVFGVVGNSVVDGMPLRWEEASDGDEEIEEDSPPDHRSWKDLSEDDRNRIIAANARHEANEAAQRIKARRDPELNRAVNTLLKRMDEPGLWADLRTFLAYAGPATEHEESDF